MPAAYGVGPALVAVVAEASLGEPCRFQEVAAEVSTVLIEVGCRVP